MWARRPSNFASPPQALCRAYRSMDCAPSPHSRGAIHRIEPAPCDTAASDPEGVAPARGTFAPTQSIRLSDHTNLSELPDVRSKAISARSRWDAWPAYEADQSGCKGWRTRGIIV